MFNRTLVILLAIAAALVILTFNTLPVYATQPDPPGPEYDCGVECTYQGRTVTCNSGVCGGGNNPDYIIYRYYCCDSCPGGGCWYESQNTCGYEYYCHN